MKDYSFICEDCLLVYTLSVEGDEPLTEAPPCCLSCGSERIKPTHLNAKDDLSDVDTATL